MSYNDNMIRAFKSGFRVGYLKAIEDFEMLTEAELPVGMKTAWQALSLIQKERKNDKNHRSK